MLNSLNSEIPFRTWPALYLLAKRSYALYIQCTTPAQRLTEPFGLLADGQFGAFRSFATNCLPFRNQMRQFLAFDRLLFQEFPSQTDQDGLVVRQQGSGTLVGAGHQARYLSVNGLGGGLAVVPLLPDLSAQKGQYSDSDPHHNQQDDQTRPKPG